MTATVEKEKKKQLCNSACICTMGQKSRDMRLLLFQKNQEREIVVLCHL
jgi:hypothetical protein